MRELMGQRAFTGTPVRSCYHDLHRAVSRPGRSCRLGVCALSSNDIRPGTTIEFENAPWRVTEFMHVKPGKGAAFVRSKLKNCITGNMLDKTFRAGEPLTAATVEKRSCQFTYVDGEDVVFMDNDSYEETRLKRDESWAKWIKEGDLVPLISWNGLVISVDYPKTASLKIASTDPGLQGNRSSAGTKLAILETGAQVQVPLFVEEGQVIKVETATSTYLGREK